MARTSGSDGYVTLAVLLIAGLLAAIVSGLLSVSRPALGLARIGGDEVAVEGLLQGGVEAAGYLLVVAKQPVDEVDGMVLRLRNGAIRLAAADEAARIDLNSADPQLLEGLFRAVGGNSMSGQAFAARVVDWRDKDGDVSEDGAESSQYEKAELGYESPNRWFHSVEELRFILRLSARDFQRLAPHLTVFSGRGKIDPLSASDTVLRAIPGFRPNDLRRLKQARQKGATGATIAASMPEIAEYLLDKPSGAFRIRVEATLADGFSDFVEAVITSPKQKDSVDYKVVSWSRLASSVPQ